MAGCFPVRVITRLRSIYLLRDPGLTKCEASVKLLFIFSCKQKIYTYGGVELHGSALGWIIRLLSFTSSFACEFTVDHTIHQVSVKICLLRLQTRKQCYISNVKGQISLCMHYLIFRVFNSEMDYKSYEPIRYFIAFTNPLVDEFRPQGSTVTAKEDNLILIRRSLALTRSLHSHSQGRELYI